MIRRDGRQYAETSREAAKLLGDDVTPANVRDWVRRASHPGDRLHGVITPHRHQGRTYLVLDEIARAEMLTRTTRRSGGRRRVDIGAAAA